MRYSVLHYYLIAKIKLKNKCTYFRLKKEEVINKTHYGIKN